MRTTKPKPGQLSVIVFLFIALLNFSSCKKDNNSNTDDNDTNTTAKIYEDAGYGYLGRFDTYFPNVPGSYYITPLDVRAVNGKIYASWLINDGFYGANNVYFGTLENKKFNKTDYSPCGDPSVNSDYRKFLRYEVDGQGNLFISYKYRQVTSAYYTMYHQFCSSSGLSSNGEQVEVPLLIRENNQQVSAVGSNIYTGYEVNDLKQYKFGYSSWEKYDIPVLKSKVQAFDYYISENGNYYLAYTDAPQGDQTSGNMNLAGFDGVAWYDLGSIPAGEVRKLIVNFFEPFKMQLIRNGDNPFIVLFRDNNTIAVFRFDGIAISLVADNVIYPTETGTQFTTLEKPAFCVFNDKLTTVGFANSSGAVDSKTSVYQLNDNAFTAIDTVPFSNVSLVGAFSDNTHLWVACEVWRAQDGVFTSPVDIIEIK